MLYDICWQIWLELNVLLIYYPTDYSGIRLNWFIKFQSEAYNLSVSMNSLTPLNSFIIISHYLEYGVHRCDLTYLHP